MAFTTTLKRIVRSGGLGFYRNRTISFSSIFVMTITLFLIAFLMLGKAVLLHTLDEVKQKVDISVYFTTNAPEEKILALQQALEKLPEVAPPTQYISREQVLANFKERHKDDTAVLQSLKEIGENNNPFGATLLIRAKDPSQYESISRFLSPEGGLGAISPNDTIIDSVNYEKNKLVIDRLTSIIASLTKIGYATSLIFIFISIMITFNTMRLAIYTFREEISIMQLVGADNLYIRGPFLFEGMLYGIIATTVVALLLLPMTYVATTHSFGFLTDMSLFEYYKTHIVSLVGTLLLVGISLGIISTFLAVRKYLVR